ncbi:MAG: sulfotransferase domain-containing protein, partial [Alphaproteobacteria bacterium]
MALPNLIIAGAPKCGTSSLFQWIADHPDAEGSLVKETCYFADAESHVFDPTSNFAAAGLAGYERFFPVSKPKARIRLEATPTYIYQNSAFQHLPDIKTRPRFLFVLREPSQQILSTYRYFKNNWTFLKAGDGFADFIEMVNSNDSRLNRNELLR